MRRRILPVSAIAVLILALALNVQAAPKAVRITEVVVDFGSSQILIFGDNLCSNPFVFLSGQQLQVNNAGPPIWVAWPGLTDGDFLLVVSCDKKGKADIRKNEVDDWNLTVGAVGPQGAPGPAGQDGAAGTVGPQGPVGAAGVAGAPGAAGPVGPAGADGVAGAPGAVGPAGPVGADGVAGAPGVVGPVGPAGAGGAAGAPGVVGPVGPAGASGAAGLPGVAGPVGPAGADGAAGSDGVAGAPGLAGSVGPAGVNGLPGPIGLQGPPGQDGVSGYEIVTVSLNVPAQSEAGVTAVCPAGKKVVGGGFARTTPFGANRIQWALASGPVANGTGWAVTQFNDAGVSAQYLVHAVCVSVVP